LRIGGLNIISPFEAIELRSEVEISEVVTMHIYAPRQNQNLLSLDEPNLYSVSKTVTAFSHTHSPQDTE
jgi:hypothetical protein